ncbi:MAG: PEP-CTERM sorting domain-containing protein [Kiritimatiellae bacterium]|nr:PEP-CTERM sorting domain-containing protein [Kiritimatiellia bacterium]
MKKLIIAVAIVCAAVVSQAAAFVWDGFDITDINGDAYTGSAVLHCVEVASISATGAITAGDLSGEDFSSDLFVAGETYNFYFTSEDADGNTYQSETVSAPAYGVGVGTFTFEGNGTWTAAPTPPGPTPVPEPTSGLLLVLGVAGLALKRKRA